MTQPLDSKQRMVAATATLMQRQGYHATGLNQIVKEAHAPKGSLYFHFPGGKEELAQAALDDAGAQTRRELMAVVLAQRDPSGAIEAVVEWFAERLVASEFADGCPVATVALEAAATSQRLQAACSRHYREWQSTTAAYLVQHGMSPADAEAAAALTVASLEGALLLARAHHDVSILRQVGAQLKALVAERITASG